MRRIASMVCWILVLALGSFDAWGAEPLDGGGLCAEPVCRLVRFDSDAVFTSVTSWTKTFFQDKTVAYGLSESSARIDFKKTGDTIHGMIDLSDSDKGLHSVTDWSRYSSIVLRFYANETGSQFNLICTKAPNDLKYNGGNAYFYKKVTVSQMGWQELELPLSGFVPVFKASDNKTALPASWSEIKGLIFNTGGMPGATADVVKPTTSLYFDEIFLKEAGDSILDCGDPADRDRLETLGLTPDSTVKYGASECSVKLGYSGGDISYFLYDRAKSAGSGKPLTLLATDTLCFRIYADKALLENGTVPFHAAVDNGVGNGYFYQQLYYNWTYPEETGGWYTLRVPASGMTAKNNIQWGQQFADIRLNMGGWGTDKKVPAGTTVYVDKVWVERLGTEQPPAGPMTMTGLQVSGGADAARAQNAEMELSFSNPVDTVCLRAETSDGQAVSRVRAYRGGTRVTLIFMEPLEDGTEYVITADRLLDTGGQNLTGAAEWRFRTAFRPFTAQAEAFTDETGAVLTELPQSGPLLVRVMVDNAIGEAASSHVIFVAFYQQDGSLLDVESKPLPAIHTGVYTEPVRFDMAGSGSAAYARAFVWKSAETMIPDGSSIRLPRAAQTESGI